MTGTSQLGSSNLLSGVNGQESPVRTGQSNKIKYSGSLSSLPLFSSLPRSAILEIETKLVFARHAAGSILYHQGEKARGFFLLFAGRVKMFAVASHARTTLLKIASSGEALGVAAAILGREHLTTGQTTEPSSLAFLQRDDLVTLMQRSRDFCRAVTHYLATECIDNATETLSLRIPSSTSQKLAATLLRLADGRGNGFPRPASLIYTHAELGQLIGASRETVTRLMNKFEDAAMIAAGKSTFSITDQRLLEEMSGLD